MMTENRVNPPSFFSCAPILILFGIFLIVSAPAAAVDFLGATLCRDHATATVTIPDDSGLRLASVEVSDGTGLLMLLYASQGDALEHLDALMTRITGHPAEHEGESMQWSGHSILAYASLIKKGTVAMAVSSDDPCEETPEVPLAPPAVPAEPQPAPPVSAPARPAAPVTASGKAEIIPQLPEEEDQTPALETEPDFQLQGNLRFAAAAAPWVDVMGIVENLSSKSYRLAAFDLSLYDTQDQLICVDTISVGMLKAGQTRAFRDSISCPDYRQGSVGSFRLQFSGGY